MANLKVWKQKPVLTFDSDKKWESWLKKNHAQETGVWLQFYKKSSGKRKFVYAQALDVGLCYGWIDGVVNRYDEHSYLQWFTQRRKRSVWSQVNIANVKRLIKAGRMRAPGLAQVNAAKKDGRWKNAYGPQSAVKVPDDFINSLSKRGKKFFETLNKANRFAIAYQLQSAKKPETRTRRKKILLKMMAKGQKLY